jgi:methionyl-tRNA formyltransferase
LKVAIFTQDERRYLPAAVGTVVEAMPGQISCIVLSPPMSTHGGALKGLLRHLPVFGIQCTLRMGFQVVWARLGPLLGMKPPAPRRYWSIEEVGRKFDIPTFNIDKVNSQEMHEVLDRHPSSLLAFVSCPQIIRPKMLRRFEDGAINVHSAPLPLYRWLMSAFSVLFHSEKETAVTVHDLAEKLDNGDIIHQEPTSIDEWDSWNSLLGKTKSAAGEALVRAIRQIDDGSVVRNANRDEDSSYFSFPTWEDARTFRSRGLRMF